MDRAKTGRIMLAHGSGGKMSQRLVEDVFLKAFTNELLAPLNDQAVFKLPSSRLALTTDSYVVNPIFFPGGDIGKLAVCGTVNDLAVGGAVPHFLTAAFIIEEGMEMAELERVADSMGKTADSAGVKIVTGDTKVVERGKGDRLFINTAGLGVVRDGIDLSPSYIRPGDVVIVSGTVGDHGVAILTHREGIHMETDVQSDCAPLNGLTKEMLAEPLGIRAMRDPTRGGLATVLNEFAMSAGVGITIREDEIPVKDAVRGACEVLGFDPLYLANEGKLVVVVARGNSKRLLEVMRSHPLGLDSAMIGEVTAEPKGRVILETSIGNKRIVEMLTGEQLPRIC